MTPPEPPKGGRRKGKAPRKSPEAWPPNELELALLEQARTELLRLRAAAGWKLRKLEVSEHLYGGLLWCLRNGVPLVRALDGLRAMAWVHATGPETTAAGQHADPVTIFGERTQGDERRLRMAKQIERWVDAGRPEPVRVSKASGGAFTPRGKYTEL